MEYFCINLNCEKPVTRKNGHCRLCAQRLRQSKKIKPIVLPNFCVDCKIEILKNSTRCNTCSAQYKASIKEKVIYKCGCGAEIDKRTKICRICIKKNTVDKRKCVDCGNKTSQSSIRCMPCHRKNKANPPKKFNCEYCAKETYDYSSNKKFNHIFCSRSCQAKWHGFKNNPMNNIENRLKISRKLKGRKTGKIPWNKGLRDPKRDVILLLRDCYLYDDWRLKVFTRDNFKCVKCGGKNIEGHHIKAFSTIIYENNITNFEEGESCEILWDINNGMTLCKSCHKETDNYGWKIKNVKHKKNKNI